MIALNGGKFQGGGNFPVLEIGIVLQDLGARCTPGKEVEYILNANAQAPDDRPPAALVGVAGNPMDLGHHLLHMSVKR